MYLFKFANLHIAKIHSRITFKEMKQFIKAGSAVNEFGCE